MPGKRGRPKGHRLSEETKRKISKSKTGQTHSIETRNKISASLVEYFKEHRSVAKEMMRRYNNVEALNWIMKHSHELDTAGIETEHYLDSLKHGPEALVGDTVSFYGHGCTPLDILIADEQHETQHIQEYRATNRHKRNSGKDFCNVIF